MRLPYSKIYRGFPDLDPFSDEVCEGYINDVRRQQSFLVQIYHAMAIVLMIIVGLPVSGAIAGLVFEGIRAWVGPHSLLAERAGLVTLGVCLFASGIACLSFRDRGLLKAIRARLAGAQCPGCGYSLLGLVVSSGMVQCPECGKVENLADRGLTAADILGADASGPLVAGPNEPG